ncbi:hypothetical protein TWF718_009845 [Orbilia javanica]|uniref:LysM domain-containing protein n=1 Tax=Orbilia javanica TaxID=47235 RepID=A0AAN8RG35_9PEZI
MDPLGAGANGETQLDDDYLSTIELSSRALQFKVTLQNQDIFYLRQTPFRIMHQSFRTLALIGFITGSQAYAPHYPRDIQARQTAVAGCNKWFTTFAGDTCTTVAAFNDITVEDLIKWNPSLKAGVCDEIILPDTSYCVGVPQAVTKTTTTTAVKPTTTGNGISTPSPVQTGMVASCNKFHFVAEGQSCGDIVSKYPGTSLDLLFKWNPAIGKACTGMWAKTYLCVGVIGGTPTTKATTTAATTAANGTPSPIGKNTTKDCKKWAYIRSGDTCLTILSRNKDVKSTLQDLVRWNPSVKADCSGLISSYFLCIVGPAAPTPTTKPKTTTANPTPTPIQSGQTKNCKGWAYVKEGQSCQDIIKAKPALKLTVAQLYAWNPAIGKDCSNMWAKTFLCVEIKK